MGPGASVLLPSTLTAPQIGTMDSLLDQIGTRPTGTQDRKLLDLWVENTSAIGGKYHGDGRPFTVTPHETNSPNREHDFEDHEIEQLRLEFGFAPAYVIDINANCRDRVDHQILAELCHHFASTLSGIINLNGALLPDYKSISRSREWPNWEQIEPRFEKWIAEQKFPGTIVAVPYDVPGGRTWACHYCTPNFLRSWLDHPRFYMIK